MQKEFRTGIVITGDAKGGVRAMQLTEGELKKLSTTQKKGQKVQKKTRKETEKASKVTKDYAGKLGLVTGAAGALTTVLAGLGMAGVVRDTVAATRETNGWANAIGVSTQELLAAEYATQSLGLSQGKIADIYKDTSEKIADAYLNGGGEAVEVLEHLNLTATDLVNLSPDKQLLAIAGGLDAVGSNAAKIQILESLASDASLLIPLLANDAEKFKQLKREAIDFNVALSSLDTAKITLLGAEFRKISASSTGLGNELTVALTPAIIGVSNEIDDLIKSWGGMGNVSELAVDSVVGWLGVVLDIFQPLQVALKHSETGWLLMGEVAVDAFVNAGAAAVELLNKVLQPVRVTISSIVEGYGYLIQAVADFSGNESWKKAADFALGYADAIKNTKYEMDDFIELQKEIELQLEKSNAELVALVNADAPSDELKKWLEKQRKEVEKLAQASLDAAAAQKELTSNQAAAVDQAKELVVAAEPIVQIYEDTATSIRGSFSGAFRDALDGQNTFAERSINILKDMLADMATMVAVRPIIIPMVTGLGGMMGVSGTAQAGIINQLGGAGNMANYAGYSGQQATMLAEQTSAFGTDGAVATAQAGGSSGFMEAAGATLGAGFMGYMAGGVAADMFNVANPGMAKNLTAMGAMIAGPWGAAIGFAISGFMGGSWQTNDSGLDLSYANNAISGESFQRQSRGNGWFQSDSTRTVFDDMDTELLGGLRGTFEQITDSFGDMGETLGRDADSVLANFTTSARLSLQGLSESEISTAIDGWIQDVANEMALEIMPGLIIFQTAGEGAADTLARLTVAVSAITALDETIAEQIFILTGGSLGELATSMGGDVDAMNSLSIAQFTGGLSDELASYAVALTNTGQSITSILNSISESSDPEEWIELEQQLYDQVMNRYRLEKEMLTEMQKSIQSVIADISGLRGAIAGDLNGISGAANYRNVAAITGDINSITPGSAPVLNNQITVDYETVISNVLANMLSKNVLVSSLETELQRLRDDYNSIEAPVGLAMFGVGQTAYLSELANAQYLINKTQSALVAEQNSLAVSVSGYSNLVAEQRQAQVAAAIAIVEYNSALDDFLSLTSGQVNQLQNLRNETLRYYNAQKQLAGAMNSAAGSIGNTLERLRYSQLAPGDRLDDRLAGFRGLVNTAENVNDYDLANISGQLSGLVDPLLSEARNLFASGQGYQDIYNEIVNSLFDIQSRLTDEAPAGYEQETVGLLNSIDGLLGTLQGELTAAERAIVDAIELGRIQTVGTLQDIRGLLGGEERTIVDGSHFNGLARVGFDGYMAKMHKDEMILDAGFSESLRKYGIPVSNSGGNINKLLPVLERIASSSEKSGGDIYLQVVTPDGNTLKEDVFNDLLMRSEKRQIVIHANGIAPA